MQTIEITVPREDTRHPLIDHGLDTDDIDYIRVCVEQRAVTALNEFLRRINYVRTDEVMDLPWWRTRALHAIRIKRTAAMLRLLADFVEESLAHATAK
jgi:hypothetical protein